MRCFYVADLNAQGELVATAEYRYELLEQIHGAAGIIELFATQIWRESEEFEVAVPSPTGSMTLRWRACAPTAGIATLRCKGELTSLSLLACGRDAQADEITFQAFQRHLLRNLQGTGYEPAFALVDLKERPIVATINFAAPADPTDQMIAALADRCFAAAYFRGQDLA